MQKTVYSLAFIFCKHFIIPVSYIFLKQKRNMKYATCYKYTSLFGHQSIKDLFRILLVKDIYKEERHRYL